MVLSNLFLAIGPGQIAVIAILVLLLFGGKKIPELMKGLGTGIKEFKKGVIYLNKIHFKLFLKNERLNLEI